MASLKRIVWLLFFFLSACGERAGLAPVAESSGRDRPYYVASKGDTLFSIAWRYDKDYREIAYYNHLDDEATLHAGQKIYLLPTTEQRKKTSHVTRQKKKVTHRVPSRVISDRWYWPAKGKVVHYFSPKKGRKGVDIQGTYGQSVRASRGGRVAYSGDGLRGYGNLIIIKHSGDYLSAYAYNRANLVKEGQWVKAGDKIAEIGKKGKRLGLLHFEVRYRGKPVNPLTMLKPH